MLTEGVRSDELRKEGNDLEQSADFERDYSARAYFWSNPEPWWISRHQDTDYAIAAAIHEVSNLTGRRKGDIHSKPTAEEYRMVLRIASDLLLMCQSFRWAEKTISREEAEGESGGMRLISRF